MDKEKLKTKWNLLQKSTMLHKEREDYALHLEELRRQNSPHSHIREKLKDIDHHLDMLTHEEKIDYTSIFKEMAHALMKLEPSSSANYHQLEEIQREETHHLQELYALEPFLTKYHLIFQKGAQLLLEGQTRSFLSSLLGRHPKVLLSYEIGRIAKEADPDLQKLDQLECTREEIVTMKAQLFSLLSEIGIEAKRKWNHALYAEAFHQFEEKIGSLKEKWKESIASCNQRLASIKDQKASWLEKHL